MTRFLKWCRVSATILLVLISLFVAGSFVPAPFGFDLRLVASKSMEPAISSGSLVVTRPFGEYKKGDIILFRKENLSPSVPPTTHRIYELYIDNSRLAYITKGDGNKYPDATPVFQEEILGKVLFSVPYVLYVLNFIKEPVGFAILVVIPVLWAVAEAVTGRKKTKGHDKGQKDKSDDFKNS